MVFFMSITVVIVLTIVVHLINTIWVKPRNMRARLSKQGIKGPKPWFLLGNIVEMKRSHSKGLRDLSHSKNGHISHDWAHSLFPFFKHWTLQHGETLMFALGNLNVLYVSNHELVKEISLSTSLDLGKPTYLQRERGPLLGRGILTSNGPLWAYQRKIVAPHLYLDKVKGMFNLMAESANELVKCWEKKIVQRDEGGVVGNIRVDEDLRSFSADVISKACFGSSYSKAKLIFQKLRALQQAMSTKSLIMGLPGLKYLPVKNNREIWRLEKEIGSLILKMVDERKKQGRDEEIRPDLFQVIIEGSQNSDLLPNEESRNSFIVDNCKNVYLAGHETTAMSACWTLLLLASHPDWQNRVRQEIFGICGGRVLDIDMLRKMNLLRMVIQEALRLYPTVVFMSREALNDIRIGEYSVPKGINIWIPVITLHRDSSIWGEDADEFKPERFENGTTGACKMPQLYLPFGAGPRICAGQNLAMLELKLFMALLLSNFSFSVSPHYHHSPLFKLVIEPEFGVNLLVTRL